MFIMPKALQYLSQYQVTNCCRFQARDIIQRVRLFIISASEIVYPYTGIHYNNAIRSAAFSRRYALGGAV